ncbi:DUF2784 domain-containing protein [Solwaraspora sp. WMMA2056]|uniref:DUF2784 domain-containing protein n=1 Tax=Solwaraspora sp. WMMA2056 TaxID=3015161 RepID=UPI00259B4F52|nr:DUF2784 domain-containing protein [Solwaraspora sp. WMMA2056]WJK39904.1 DUF2784 domain-containing protein [Solwaraspora sp. WMMA2056]
MGYQLLTTVILILHFGFLAYLAVGGFLAWRWPRTIWLHLCAAGWGVLVVAANLSCPLTVAEHWSRRRAGQVGFDEGFVDRYLSGVIYPERYAWLAQLVLAAAVAVSWAGAVRAARRRRRRSPLRSGSPR